MVADKNGDLLFKGDAAQVRLDAAAGLLKVQSQRFPYFVIGHFVSRQVDWIKAVHQSFACEIGLLCARALSRRSALSAKSMCTNMCDGR